MNKLYKNANGKEYEILAMVGEIGLLKEVVEGSNQESPVPYILALGFSPYISSWGDGKYFKTLGEAKEEFKKKVRL